MAKSPAFQYYPKDWKDKRVQRMSYEARGVYWEILGHMWTDSKDQCSIEKDERALSRILGLSATKVRKNLSEIQWKGDPILIERKGLYISRRLQKVKRQQVINSKVRSEAGKKGAEERWHNDGKGIANPMAKNGLSSSSPTSSSAATSSSSSSSSSKSKPSESERRASIQTARERIDSHPNQRTRFALLKYLGFVENSPAVPGHRIEDLMKRAWGLRESIIGDDGVPADEIFEYAIDQAIQYKAVSAGYVGRVIQDSIMRWRDGSRFVKGTRTGSKGPVRKGSEGSTKPQRTAEVTGISLDKVKAKEKGPSKKAEEA